MGRSQRHLREIRGIDSSGNKRGLKNDPRSLTAPVIAGTARVGFVLTGTNGTFKGPGKIVVTRQWYKGGVAIPNATGATYNPVAGDVGSTITFRNTATSQYGSVSRSSAATAAVIAA